MKEYPKILHSIGVYVAFLALFLLIYPTVCLGSRTGIANITDGAERFVLENGLTVILKEDHSAPVASVQVWVRTGSANESEEEAGITHIIEHMIFKGTPRRMTGEIARSIESSGGEINAYTTFDRTVYFVEIPGGQVEKALDVLLDAVRNSLFDPLELSREKEVILEEYRRSLDIPERQLNRALFDLAFKSHPYGRPVIGYESTIRSIGRDDILRYRDKWYTAGNMVLVVVGDIRGDEVLETIRSLTRDFPEGPVPSPSRPAEPPQSDTRSRLLRENVMQAYMDMSWHVPPLSHHDTPALDLLGVIMGQGRSSRLYNRLRMETNLVRSIGSGVYSMADSGLFSIESTLSPGNLNETIESIAREVAGIRRGPVSEAELSKAKSMAEADYLSEMESMKGQARSLGFFETMAGDMYKADTYLERLRAVTVEDINNVANLHLRPGNLSICLMVPEKSDISLSEEQIAGIFSLRPSKESGTIDRTKQENETKIIRNVLSNGMRVIIKENHRLPLVSMRAVSLGGTHLEDPEHSGISGFVARMLTRGTHSMNALQIASTVESRGAEIEGFSGRNSFGISAKFLSRDLYPGLDLLADVIINPSFPEDEMERVREDILADIKAKKDSPTKQLFDLFNRTLYRNHPYGRPGTGSYESINSIKRSDLMEWHRSLVVPSNLVLTVVGDVRGDEFLGKAEEIFEGLDSPPFDPPKILPEPPLRGEREIHLERPGEQVHILIGYLGADLKSHDNAVLTLIDTALSGLGGRLFRELRDRQGLAYSISSFHRPGLETGAFGVYLSCEPKKLPVAKEALFMELEKLKKEGLTLEELEEAKRYVLGTEAIAHQTNGRQAMSMALDELYGLGYDHYEKFLREIREVTLDDILRTAQRIFLTHGYTMVTVGPLS